ncbi:MAG: serine hydrolase [Pseudomonadota bacterium]|nr:serine hydrolase [Pseudomonadota bacterium]
MRQHYLLCLAALFVIQAPASFAETAPQAVLADQALAARIDAVVAPYYKAGEPGATVIVLRDGQTLFRKAYGMADVAKKLPMTPETSLRLGSITKQFTSTAIMMLADEGKLAVTDDITKFLPDYPTRGKHITIEHLLTHTSGIVSYTGKPTFGAISTTDMSVAQMIDFFKNDPLEFEPGARWHYNNSGYFLLGAIIEKVSGMPYARFVEQRIFVPLGMDHTAYEGYERTPGARAQGHTGAAGHYLPSAPLSMSQPYAAGALVSTVDDLARWDGAVSSGKLLTAASWQKAFTPYTLAGGGATGYGYGWQIDKLQGQPTIGHGGGINGFSTYAVRLPAEKVYVAVLTNADSAKVAPEVVASKVAAIVIGKPHRQFTAIKPDPASLAAFAGVYQIDDKANRTFRVEDGALMMARTGRGSIAVQAFSDHGFFVPDTLDYMEFGRDASGAVNQVSYHHGDKVSVQPRSGVVQERVVIKVPAAVLDTYVGRYQLTPAMFVDVRRDGDRLFGQATGQAALELFATTETQFFTREVNAQVGFDKDADGTPRLMLNHDGHKASGKKMP